MIDSIYKFILNRLGDILEKPMFLCMLCDSETDFRLCDECITKTDKLEVYR